MDYQQNFDPFGFGKVLASMVDFSPWQKQMGLLNQWYYQNIEGVKSMQSLFAQASTALNERQRVSMNEWLASWNKEAEQLSAFNPISFSQPNQQLAEQFQKMSDLLERGYEQWQEMANLIEGPSREMGEQILSQTRRQLTETANLFRLTQS